MKMHDIKKVSEYKSLHFSSTFQQGELRMFFEKLNKKFLIEKLKVDSSRKVALILIFVCTSYILKVKEKY